jgi:hypothetical protein
MNPHHPTGREARVSEALRAAAVGEIEKRRIEDVADCLAMKVSGVKSLLWEPHWSLETAFRVADALDLAVTREIEAFASERATAL